MTLYHRPRTLNDALALLADDPALTILAGGTDLIPAAAARAGWGERRPARMLDLSAVPGLKGIERREASWWIGALTTWSDLLRAPLPAQFDGLKAAAREVGGVQIQARGTLVGNICTASPAADGVPPLLTLDAHVEMMSARARRKVPLAAFIDGYRHTVRRADEIVTAIEVPAHDGCGRFTKLGARRYLVISIVMVAALALLEDDQRIADIRVAVGSCSAVAQRLPALERLLVGRRLGDVDAGLVAPELLAHLEPLDDVRASAGYRRHAARELVSRLLEDFGAPVRSIA